MKRVCVGLAVVSLLFSGVVKAEDPANVALKAGPTEPGESLSMVWVESFVSPKTIKEEKILSLGVRTTSRVKEVKVAFDFFQKQVVLSSSDGVSWSGVLELPDSIAGGAHVARYEIKGNKGTIQRTVEFFVEKASSLKTAAAPRVETTSWPLTVVASCSGYTTDSRVRNLPKGQVITGLSKVPWYKVVFSDGKEGWISASNVKEPTEEYYLLGYEAYESGDYRTAVKYYQKSVSVDPEFMKGYLWLSKSYAALSDFDAAAASIAKALQLDARDVNCRLVANNLAQRYFSLAHGQFKSGKYNEAIASYRKLLELKPTSMLSWRELGDCYKKMGMEEDARDTWKEGLKHDVENKELRALVGGALVAAVTEPDKKKTIAVAPKARLVSPMLADDSLRIIKGEKTKKGTKIETAIKSVIALTKSLGTPVVEKGWQIRRKGEKFMVSYLCEQSGGGAEAFDWMVDVDTRQIVPQNENARLLMARW